MKHNISKANRLANSFNKENGVIVYSGTLAIESALICAGIKKDDKVLVSSATCYSIFEAITKIGAIPVIVIPKNKLALTIDEIKHAIKQEKDIKCFIAVHQYGIVQNMREVKKLLKNEIIIIEDVAQAWNLLDSGYNAGLYSDYVITSFGKTKPLSYGIGGAIFSNNSLKEHFDFYDNESRKSFKTLISYTYPDCKKINIEKLMKIGDKNIKKQIKIAELLTLGLIDNNEIEIITDSIYNRSTWHRFPLIIKNKKYARKVQIALEKSKTKYQLPHEDELYEIDMVNNSSAIIIGENTKEHDIILVRTRNNNVKNIKKFLKMLKES